MSERLQHKMISYAVTPPATAWDTIATRLNDDEKYETLSARVLQWGTFPPPQICSEVLNALDKQPNNRSVSRTRRWIYRSAAAAVAACVLLVAWTVFYRDAVTVLVTKVTAPVIQPAGKNNISIVAPDSTDTVNQAAVSAGNTGSAVLKRGQSFTGASLNENVLPYALVSNPETLHPVAMISAPPVTVRKEDLLIITGLPASGNYLMVEGADGKLTRISAKFSNLIGLLTDSDEPETDLDKIQTNSNWKERFREWRNKIRESSYIPASANFLDIMELKDLILEEK